MMMMMMMMTSHTVSVIGRMFHPRGSGLQLHSSYRGPCWVMRTLKARASSSHSAYFDRLQADRNCLIKIKSRKIRITIAQVRIDIQFATLYPDERVTFSELQFTSIAGTLNITCIYANYYWRLTKFPPTIICMISC